MLYKTIAIVLSTLFIVAAQASTASAGGCHGGFGRLAFHQFQVRQNQSYAFEQARKRRAAEARAIAAAKAEKKAAAIRAAKAERKAEEAKVAAADPAPVATEVADTGKAPDAPVKVADAGQTCTRFVAEIGTTVTTDCAGK